MGPVAPGRAESRQQCPVRRGRGGDFFRRQALLPGEGSALPGTQGAGGIRRGGRAGRYFDRGASAYRHLPPRFHGGGDAAADRGAGRRISLAAPGERKSVVSGKGVSVRGDLGGRRVVKKKKRKGNKWNRRAK